MVQYLDLLGNLLKNGVEKESGRENMPNTIGISNGIIRMDLQEGFPLLTTKEMHFKSIVYELLWFLKGDTNIKYLIDNDVKIWNDDAYRWYCKYGKDNNSEVNSILRSNEDGSYSMFTKEQFIEKIKKALSDKYLPKYGNYMLGDLGKIYGYQWRRKVGIKDGKYCGHYYYEIDQLKECISNILKNPYSRYHIINAWDKADLEEMALPPCHLLYQFIVRPISKKERLDMAIFKYELVDCEWNIGNVDKMLDKYEIPKFYLDLNMYQRSCDIFLGVPFNIASMSLLLTIVAKLCKMLPGVSTWIGGDVHVYLDHISVVHEQLNRVPFSLPQLEIHKELNSFEDILNLEYEDFQLINYKPYSKLKAELFTGLKK